MSSDPRPPYDLWSFPMPQDPVHDAPPTAPYAYAYEPPASSGPPRAPKRSMSRGQRWRIAAACALGLAVVAAGLSVADFVDKSPSSISAAVDVPVGTSPSGSATTPTTPSTPRATPSTTPDGQTPRSTPTTVPQTTPSTPRTTAQTDLTIGLVNINTVLGFERAEAAGTGIVLSADGRVLTNNHVIEGATEIEVTVVATGKTYLAKVVGTAPSDDIALLQLEKASGLAVAPLGDSSTVDVGEAVVGIGNAGGTGTPNTSPGTVTALGRTITATDSSGGNAETLHNLIESSARLQPGQSGGPLYDASGLVVGVNSAGSSSSGFGGRSRMGGGAAGVTQGYSIPINDALALVSAIEKGQASDRITIGTPPMLGVSAGDAADGGAVVSGVTPGTPAAKIGLAAGDIIVGIDRTAIDSVADLSAALRTHEVGDKVTVTWNRNGVTKSATATLIAGPAN